MTVFARLAGAFGAIVALFGLGACATGPSLTPAQMEGIRAGTGGAIIMSYHEYAGMYGGTVTFANLETRGLYQVSMHGGDNWVNAGPDMVAVPPGRYRVYSGGLYGYQVTGAMPLLAYWFDDFEVAGGEVVDVGALSIEDINVRSLPGMADQVLYALLTFDRTQTNTYLAYKVEHSDEARVQHMLASKYPTLGVTPVRRPLKALLDRAAFERVVVEAYAPGPDGAVPTNQEAEARVGASLQRFIRDSRAAARP